MNSFYKKPQKYNFSYIVARANSIAAGPGGAPTPPQRIRIAIPADHLASDRVR